MSNISTNIGKISPPFDGSRDGCMFFCEFDVFRNVIRSNQVKHSAKHRGIDHATTFRFMQISDFKISLAMFELLYWRKNYRKFHCKPVPISFESWSFDLIISSIRLNISSLVVCRILASNYQANNHYNRAGAKCPIFLFMDRLLNCRLVASCSNNL